MLTLTEELQQKFLYNFFIAYRCAALYFNLLGEDTRKIKNVRLIIQEVIEIYPKRIS